MGFAKRIDSGLASIHDHQPKQNANGSTSKAAPAHAGGARAAAGAAVPAGGSSKKQTGPASGEQDSDSDDTEYSESLLLDADSIMKKAFVYTGALDREGMSPDLFGQKSPSFLRERIQKSILKKGSGQRRTQRFQRAVEQFVSSTHMITISCISRVLCSSWFVSREPSEKLV
jgi:hypothetical protein